LRILSPPTLWIEPASARTFFWKKCAFQNRKIALSFGKTPAPNSEQHKMKQEIVFTETPSALFCLRESFHWELVRGRSARKYKRNRRVNFFGTLEVQSLFRKSWTAEALAFVYFDYWPPLPQPNPCAGGRGGTPMRVLLKCEKYPILLIEVGQ
jgi:hypothetical protein